MKLDFTDPRSTQGTLSRGNNVYNASSMNSGANQHGKYTSAAQNAVMNKPSMKTINYAEVAKRWLQRAS